MAQLAAAFASSHSIMLAARVENWLTGFTAIDAYPENLRVGLMASGGLRITRPA